MRWINSGGTKDFNTREWASPRGAQKTSSLYFKFGPKGFAAPQAPRVAAAEKKDGGRGGEKKNKCKTPHKIDIIYI